MARNVEPEPLIVREDGGACEYAIGIDGAGVVGGGWPHHERHRGCRGLSAGIDCGVGEGVQTAVSGGWRVGVGAVGIDGDGAVGRQGEARHGEIRADVIGQHGCTDECGVGVRGGSVCRHAGKYGDRHGSRRRLTAGVGCGVGERIRARVSAGRCVGVRAIGCNGDGTVDSCGVPGDAQPTACIVGQN